MWCSDVLTTYIVFTKAANEDVLRNTVGMLAASVLHIFIFQLKCYLNKIERYIYIYIYIYKFLEIKERIIIYSHKNIKNTHTFIYLCILWNVIVNAIHRSTLFFINFL